MAVCPLWIHTMQTRRNHSEILSVKLCFKETFTIPLSLLIKTRNCQEDYQKKSHGVKSNWFWSTATIQRYHSSKSMKLEVFSELYLRKYNSPLSIKLYCPWWGVGPVEDGQLQVTQQWISYSKNKHLILQDSKQILISYNHQKVSLNARNSFFVALAACNYLMLKDQLVKLK